MASSKRQFAGRLFAGRLFAPSLFRGVAVEPPVPPAAFVCVEALDVFVPLVRCASAGVLVAGPDAGGAFVPETPSRRSCCDA